MAFRDSDSPIFEDRCVFKDNEAAQYGGAIAYERSDGEVRDTVFLTNTAGVPGTGGGGGGAVVCFSQSSPSFDRCHFEGNEATTWGGAIYAWTNSSPRFAGSLLTGNQAAEGGGALSFSSSRPSFEQCTLVANSAQIGGGLRGIGSGSGFVLARSILAFSPEGSSVECGDGAAVDVQCSLVFGNLPRNWNTQCISSQEQEPGNLGADPLFCFPEIQDYRLSSNSPAAATETCGTLGAREVGCAP